MDIQLNRLPYFARVWAGSHTASSKLLPARITPQVASLKLTENCQAKCLTCDYWKSHWNDLIDTDTAVHLINELGDLGIPFLRFTGGEPLLRRDLFTVLQRSRTSAFKRISIQTNGLALKKLHQQLNDSPITRVSVSIDGIGKDNDRLRGIDGYFDLALEGISLLKNKQLQICVTLSRGSIRQLEDLLALARDLNADFAFNLVENNLYFEREVALGDLWPEEADLEALGSILSERLNRPGYEVKYIQQYFRRDPALSKPPCVMGFIDVIIASNGDVLTGCAVLAPIGNIRKEPLSDIFGSIAYKARCLAMVHRECPGCMRGYGTNLRFQHLNLKPSDIRTLVAAHTATTRDVSSYPK